MQTTTVASRAEFLNLFITLACGAAIGLITVGFITALRTIEVYHDLWNQSQPWHLLLIPLVLLILEAVRKRTLYFPLKVFQLGEEKSSSYWSALMAPIHFLGTLLSHISGVSVGREGAAVLYSAGLVRLFNLSWQYWGPVLSSIGFASVVGNYWVAPFFMFELFGRTGFLQKIYAFVGAAVAVLLAESLQLPHLFPHLTDEKFMSGAGFFKKLFVLFLFGASAGYLMRLYKYLYFSLADYFKHKPLYFKVIISALVAGLLFLPEFRKYQSLGILQLADVKTVTFPFIGTVIKLAFTLLCTALGFMGGEFIPLVFAGVYFGSAFLSGLGFEAFFGAILGAYLLFAAGTRFKWTSIVLIVALTGFSWLFWVYFLVSTAISFSGADSLYRQKSFSNAV